MSLSAAQPIQKAWSQEYEAQSQVLGSQRRSNQPGWNRTYLESPGIGNYVAVLRAELSTYSTQHKRVTCRTEWGTSGCKTTIAEAPDLLHAWFASVGEG